MGKLETTLTKEADDMQNSSLKESGSYHENEILEDYVLALSSWEKKEACESRLKARHKWIDYKDKKVELPRDSAAFRDSLGVFNSSDVVQLPRDSAWTETSNSSNVVQLPRDSAWTETSNSSGVVQLPRDSAWTDGGVELPLDSAFSSEYGSTVKLPSEISNDSRSLSSEFSSSTLVKLNPPSEDLTSDDDRSRGSLVTSVESWRQIRKENLSLRRSTVCFFINSSID